MSSEYAAGLEIMKQTTDALIAAGIPKDEHPPLFADHLMYMALALSRDNAEQGALAILRRMEDTLNDWRVGNPPFQEWDGQREDDGETRHPFASLRAAMEHMVQFGGMDLDQAAACFGIFAMGLVKDHEGIDRVRALLSTWTAEFEQMTAGE